jgi:uncharacterized protein (DUF697 family)
MATGSKKKSAAALTHEYPTWSLPAWASGRKGRRLASFGTRWGPGNGIYPFGGTTAGAEPPPIVVRAFLEEPQEIVQKYVIWAVVGGFLPFAVLDIAFLTVVNYYLIKELSEYYNVNMDGKRTWDLVSALFAGLVPQAFTAGAPGALLRLIPVVGQFLNGFTQAAFAGGSTYLLGKVAIENLKAYGGRTAPETLYEEISDAAFRWHEYAMAEAADEAAA